MTTAVDQARIAAQIVSPAIVVDTADSAFPAGGVVRRARPPVAARRGPG